MYKSNQTQDLPETLASEIEQNSRDMNRFYTLRQEKRDDVLERICRHNTPEKLAKSAKNYKG